MIRTTPTPQNLATDAWIRATWETHVTLADDPTYAKGRCYYDDGWMRRIEMAALGPLHGRDNSIVSTLIILFATLKNIRIVELTNTTFRKPGTRDGQPDIAF